MEFTLEEVQLLLTGICKLSSECYRIENEYHGMPVTAHLRRTRSKHKSILKLQEKLVAYKISLEKSL